ncbi:hypothetical protein R1flu_018565 [Riccia fluitans]|uniref:Uncharacterized protein n=1 Tax=Riccia fluitans TaxID=41844 RepID=A0ABD1ZH81_9MARC
MGCSRHPYEGAVGVCASCVSDRLNKERGAPSSTSDRRGGGFAAGSRSSSKPPASEDYYLRKEGAASTSSSISKHGQLTKGGRIVDTIASLIKTDYAIPTNYERPRSSSRTRHRGSSSNRGEHSSRSGAAEARSRIILVPDASSSRSKNKAVSTTDDEDDDTEFRKFHFGCELSNRENDNGHNSSSSIVVSKSREICEIVPVTEEEEEGAEVVERGEEKPVQTIHSLIDAEPKSGAKFSRSTSKGSPSSSSYFSRSGSRRRQQQQQSSWTVFWRHSDKKDQLHFEGGAGNNTSRGVLVPGLGGRTAGNGRGGRTSVLSVNHEDSDDYGTNRARPMSNALALESSGSHRAEASSSQYYPDRRSSTRFSSRDGEEKEEGVSNGGRRRLRLPVYDDEYQQQRRDGNSGFSDDSPQWRQRGGGAAVSNQSLEGDQTWEQLRLANLPFASVYYAPPSPPPTGNNDNENSNNNPHHHNNGSDANNKNNATGGNSNLDGSSNDANGHHQQGGRNRWKMVKEKSGKLLLMRGGKPSVAGDSQQQQQQRQQQQHVSSSTWTDEDLGGGQSSSGKLTPCTSNCFPKASGMFQQTSNNILKREDAHLSHEKLRNRRLSIYSYGIISHPQLNPLNPLVDSHFSSYSYGGGSAAVGGGAGGRVAGSNSSRAPLALPHRSNGSTQARDSYYHRPSGTGRRIVSDLWDGEELSASPCDHYVEVSNGADGGLDFIPVSEARGRAADEWMERSKLKERRSPPSWNERTFGQSSVAVDKGEEEQQQQVEDEEQYLSGSDSGFRGKEDLTPVFEPESDCGYEDYPLDRETDDHVPHDEKQLKQKESYRSVENSPNSETPPPAGKSRQAKGKNIISEIEEMEEGDAGDHMHEEYHRRSRKQQQHIGGYSLVTVKSPLSDVGSHSELEIVPGRNSLSALLYLDGEEVLVFQKKRGGEAHEGRSNKPDNHTYELGEEEDRDQEEQEEVEDSSSWAMESLDHRDSQTNDNSGSAKLSPWKNITLSSSMRRKFLWPRSSPLPNFSKISATRGNSGPLEMGFSGPLESEYHNYQSTLSFSDSEFQLARPRSPTSTIDNASSNIMTSEGRLPQHDEVTVATSETLFSLQVGEEVEEASLRSSPQRSSLSQASSPRRASLSRSSSKSPHRTFSRCSSRRSRSSSWSSCLTDPAWTSQSQAPSNKGENTGERDGPFSSLISRLGKTLGPPEQAQSRCSTSSNASALSALGMPRDRDWIPFSKYPV